MKKLLILICLLLTLPTHAETLNAGVIYEDGRTLTPFYFNGELNGYGVQYDNDLYHAYYYDLTKNLVQYDVLDKPRNVFPHTTVSYDGNGNIISFSKSVSKEEQYVYKPDGSLKAHWIKNDCFDSNGNKLSSKRDLQ